jgi:hypothetical protein
VYDVEVARDDGAYITYKSGVSKRIAKDLVKQMREKGKKARFVSEREVTIGEASDIKFHPHQQERVSGPDGPDSRSKQSWERREKDQGLLKIEKRKVEV